MIESLQQTSDLSRVHPSLTPQWPRKREIEMDEWMSSVIRKIPPKKTNTWFSFTTLWHKNPLPTSAVICAAVVPENRSSFLPTGASRHSSHIDLKTSWRHRGRAVMKKDWLRGAFDYFTTGRWNVFCGVGNVAVSARQLVQSCQRLLLKDSRRVRHVAQVTSCSRSHPGAAGRGARERASVCREGSEEGCSLPGWGHGERLGGEEGSGSPLTPSLPHISL